MTQRWRRIDRMSERIVIRPVNASDRDAWAPLWDGYNAFYRREGATAVPAEATDTTWARFLDAAEPMHALVAELDGRLVGLTHYLYHRNTVMIPIDRKSVV